MTLPPQTRPASGRTAVRPLPNALAPTPGSTRVDLVRRSSRGCEHAGHGLDDALVDCALYVAGARSEVGPSLREALAGARAQPGGFVWIGLHEPDAASLQGVAEELGLHPLAVEDAVHAHQRPKLEHYGDDQMFLVLKTVRYVDEQELIETGELMVFVGDRYVITVRHGEAAELSGVRAELEARPELLGIGPSAVLYAVVDRVVDGYAPAAADVEQDVDEIEDEVFGAGRLQPTERIYKLKREVMEFRRAVEPLVPATAVLQGGELRCLDPRTAPYFRDVHDHVVRASEHIAAMSELLDSVLSSNLAQVSMRQNEDMRRISAWVAIAAVSTLIAGVYGMNFDVMPELRWRFGYPYALGLMAVCSFLLHRGFRRNHWL